MPHGKLKFVFSSGNFAEELLKLNESHCFGFLILYIFTSTDLIGIHLVQGCQHSRPVDQEFGPTALDKADVVVDTLQTKMFTLCYGNTLAGTHGKTQGLQTCSMM